MAIDFVVKEITSNAECDEMLDYVELLDGQIKATGNMALVCVKMLATGYIDCYLMSNYDRKYINHMGWDTSGRTEIARRGQEYVSMCGRMLDYCKSALNGEQGEACENVQDLQRNFLTKAKPTKKRSKQNA